MYLMYFVYIVECMDGSLYTGITTDLHRRMAEHAEGVASRYTRARKFKCLRYSETAKNRATASQREYEIKQLSKRAKVALCATK